MTSVMLGHPLQSQFLPKLSLHLHSAFLKMPLAHRPRSAHAPLQMKPSQFLYSPILHLVNFQESHLLQKAFPDPQVGFCTPPLLPHCALGWHLPVAQHVPWCFAIACSCVPSVCKLLEDLEDDLHFWIPRALRSLLEKKKILLSENISDGKEQNQWRDMKKVFQAVQSGEIKMCKLEWGNGVRWKSNKQASGSRASALRGD